MTKTLYLIVFAFLLISLPHTFSTRDLYTSAQYPKAPITDDHGMNNVGRINGFPDTHDNFCVRFLAASIPEEVTIDIVPKVKSNTIDLNLKSVPIPVAILSTPSLNAPKSIDLDSLTFGHSGNEKSLVFCSPVPVDVNGDKIRDLICFFNMAKAGFQCGDTQGILKGQTTDGKAIQGIDSVKIIPCE